MTIKFIKALREDVNTVLVTYKRITMDCEFTVVWNNVHPATGKTERYDLQVGCDCDNEELSNLVREAINEYNSELYEEIRDTFDSSDCEDLEAHSNMDFEILDIGYDDEHALTSCTVSVTYNNKSLDVQMTCKLHRTSLNCQTYTEDDISDEDMQLMIEYAETYLIYYCANRFVDCEYNNLSCFEVFFDNENDEYVVIESDSNYLNKDASPYTIPYEIVDILSEDELKEAIAEEVYS